MWKDKTGVFVKIPLLQFSYILLHRVSLENIESTSGYLTHTPHIALMA